ncbi:MAG: hypothetical protein WD875_07740, partial [Pirellulales bacterium]
MTKIPNFADVPLRTDGPRATRDQWKAAAGDEAERLVWETPEQIGVRPLYSSKDLDGVDHLDTMPG